MAFVPVPNTAMVELRWTLFNQQVENVLYFANVDVPDPSSLTDLADHMASWATTTLISTGAFAPQLTFREAFVTDLTTATSPTGLSVTGAGTAGNGASPALPGNVAACISFRTNGRGRASRGRNYLMGIQQDVTSGNQLNAVHAAALTGAYEDHITTPPSGWTWVVVSRQLNGVARAQGQVTPIVSCGFTDLNLDSQRRRLTGRGQ